MLRYSGYSDMGLYESIEKEMLCKEGSRSRANVKHNQLCNYFESGVGVVISVYSKMSFELPNRLPKILTKRVLHRGISWAGTWEELYGRLGMNNCNDWTIMDKRSFVFAAQFSKG